MEPRNLPRSLVQRVSPPPLNRSRPKKLRKLDRELSVQEHKQKQNQEQQYEPWARRHSQSPEPSADPKPAAVEAGLSTVEDPASFFSTLFGRVLRRQPQLSIDGFSRLFGRNSGNPHGRHFVVHQHDHPRAGLHYDLRLQISATSSCSWAIPYGLPGNANERRHHGRRQAIETRIHALWSHLVESAGNQSGSMLIWDTGEYEILPYDKRGRESKAKEEAQTTADEEDSCYEDDDDECSSSTSALTHTERLCIAFRTGKIRVRLKGSKLPKDYTIAIYLSKKAKYNINPERAMVAEHKKSRRPPLSSERLSTLAYRGPLPGDSSGSSKDKVGQEMDWESDDEVREAKDDAIRLNNAYPGSQNTIDSVRSRFWFVMLDKASCGFHKERDEDGRVEWKRSEDGSQARSYPFFVRGRDFEKSVVTGRKAADIMHDEGAGGFVPRAGWRPILS